MWCFRSLSASILFSPYPIPYSPLKTESLVIVISRNVAVVKHQLHRQQQHFRSQSFFTVRLFSVSWCAFCCFKIPPVRCCFARDLGFATAASHFLTQQQHKSFSLLALMFVCVLLIYDIKYTTWWLGGPAK